MLSAQENERITATGPGTPAGDLMRRFWQPAALVDELPDNRPVVPVRLLGEDLVLFRGDDGKYALMDRYCPHRGVDLSFGRLEDGGLRCPFHGWLFGLDGQCMEMPAEPEESRFHEKICQTAYPCEARNGIVFAWMGPGEPPPLPRIDCFAAPDEYTFAFKGLIDCNWLQALEVGIDPAHASFLHRFLQDEDPAESYGKQFRDYAVETEMPMTRVLREYPRPEIEVEETGYGLRITALRDLDNAGMHVRITNQLFPHAIVIPMSNEMTITQWHVPIDDESCYWYAIFTSFADKVDKKTMREQRLELYELPDYKPRLNRANNWGFDPAEQATKTYTGMGMDINVHDQWAVESPGAIYDRRNEHLGQSDKAIIAYRRLLRRTIKALEDGETLSIGAEDGAGEGVPGPIAVDAIGPADDWQACWRERDQARRAASAWAASA